MGGGAHLLRGAARGTGGRWGEGEKLRVFINDGGFKFHQHAIKLFDSKVSPESFGRGQVPVLADYFAFNAVHAPLDENEYAERFPSLTGNRKTYAGMLSALDDAVGRVLAKVGELGQEENTLVMFYSDNGGPTQQTTSRNDPLRGYKGQFFEGGIRVSFVM